MNQRVRRNAFLFALHVTLLAYLLLTPRMFNLDSIGRTVELVHVATGVVGLCAVFYGAALWIAWLDADDEKQRRWEAERQADDSIA